MIFVILSILFILFFAICIVSASAPPKEKCPMCGEDVYPIELDNSLYRECPKCGWKESV